MRTCAQRQAWLQRLCTVSRSQREVLPRCVFALSHAYSLFRAQCVHVSGINANYMQQGCAVAPLWSTRARAYHLAALRCSK